MYSINLSLRVLFLTFGGALLGIYLRSVIFANQLTPDTRAVITLCTGIVVTITGLVLGLLVSSAKSCYDAQRLLVAQLSSKLILLDRALRSYGPETKPICSQLDEFVEAALHRIWPAESRRQAQLQPEDGAEKLEQLIGALVPKEESQLSAKVRATAGVADLEQTCWSMFVQSKSNVMSKPLLFVLISWLVMIFINFGLLAQPNPLAFIALLFGAIAVSAAILIITEMYTPFSGIQRLSSGPIRDALNQVRRCGVA
ncbi:MAG: hypothetical protein WA354_08475 [Terracidiphilus sp.]